MAFPQVGGNSSKEKVEQKEEEDGAMSTVVAVGVAAVAIGVAAVGVWGLSKLFGGTSNEKMMKAPGKDYFIPRKEFESNPADWFRNHRSN